ncbi:MAG TPA: type II toxin-antitoxin system prevent-host-death family antitoxin [Allosphingosinicella sp.]|nr:type II toxin-antitoxin system prevent-host-death family antitoxin [Allosphingosinicella sp.]
MHISVTEAKGKLTDLVRRAEAGDEVILTRGGEPKVRLTPVPRAESSEDIKARRRAALDAFQGCLKGKPGFEGVDAARVTDFLYDDNGLPA